MKRFARLCFLPLAALPWLWWKIFSPFLGAERAFQGCSQFCALIPGIAGTLLRAAFYHLSLRGSSQETSIGFLTTFSHPGAKLEKHVSSGVSCNIGWAHIGEECLLGSHICITSGKRQHEYADPATPIRRQGGRKEKVTIGRDCWIGNASVIMSDVGEGCVVAAGSVVVSPVPPFSVVAGNPARIINSRLPQDQSAAPARSEGETP